MSKFRIRLAWPRPIILNLCVTSYQFFVHVLYCMRRGHHVILNTTLYSPEWVLVYSQLFMNTLAVLHSVHVVLMTDCPSCSHVPYLLAREHDAKLCHSQLYTVKGIYIKRKVFCKALSKMYVASWYNKKIYENTTCSMTKITSANNDDLTVLEDITYFH